jgi:hypothetical protein
VTSRGAYRFLDAAAEWPGVRIFCDAAGHYRNKPRNDGISRKASHIDGVLSANDVMSLGIIAALGPQGGGSGHRGARPGDHRVKFRQAARHRGLRRDRWRGDQAAIRHYGAGAR